MAVDTRPASGFQTIIGLEVHAQVLTRTKMYCGCSADYANAEPNTHVCPVCLGLPGALPVINGTAIETVLRTGLALECQIPAFSKMDRKNYVYPDLPKGYQVSQYDLPLCVNGAITFELDTETRRTGITRVHIEEDTGRLVHDDMSASSASLVDLNRSGVPLMEIVGEPDLRSPAEAREYLVALRRILRYVDASSGNMEDGAFRCDANISIRAHDGSFIGPKVEIKNMNSFRAVERALRFEEERQRRTVEQGGSLVQETRGWLEARGETVSQRTKEGAQDYRYFPEPDLPPLSVLERQLAPVRASIPELPLNRARRFQQEYELSRADADLLAAERPIADIFEAATSSMADSQDRRSVANWLLNDVMGLARARSMAVDELPLSANQIRDLVTLIRDGTLTARVAKDLLPQLEFDEPVEAAALRLDLVSVSDEGALLEAAQVVIAANPAAVADFRSGKGAAIGRLIGETMRSTGGRAQPGDVRAALLSLIADDEGNHTLDTQ